MRNVLQDFDLTLELTIFQKLLRDYIANHDKCGINYYCYQIASHVWVLDWHIYVWPWRILKVEVKVIHILHCEYIWNGDM